MPLAARSISGQLAMTILEAAITAAAEEQRSATDGSPAPLLYQKYESSVSKAYIYHYENYEKFRYFSLLKHL